MKKDWVFLLVTAVGAYALYKGVKSYKAAPKLKEPLPAGVALTGKTQQTQNGRPPNYPGETVGYAIRNWAEVKTADGRTDWVELA